MHDQLLKTQIATRLGLYRRARQALDETHPLTRKHLHGVLAGTGLSNAEIDTLFGLSQQTLATSDESGGSEALRQQLVSALDTAIQAQDDLATKAGMSNDEINSVARSLGVAKKYLKDCGMMCKKCRSLNGPMTLFCSVCGKATDNATALAVAPATSACVGISVLIFGDQKMRLIGLIFAIVGIVPLCLMEMKRRMTKRSLPSGRYEPGEPKREPTKQHANAQQATYERFVNGRSAQDIVGAAREIESQLQRGGAVAAQLMDLLRPKTEVPRLGPTGRPLLDLTGGRPDTPSWIAYRLITDQTNPNYDEYCAWIRRNRGLFEGTWLTTILRHLIDTSSVQEVREQCAKLTT